MITEKNKKFIKNIKLKYPKLFDEKNLPFTNIFIESQLKNINNFDGCFMMDEIYKLKNNHSLILNLNDSNQQGSHWCALKYFNKTLYYFDSLSTGFVNEDIKKIYPKIIINLINIQDLYLSIKCGLFCCLFILYDVNNMKKFIDFLMIFDPVNKIKNDKI